MPQRLIFLLLITLLVCGGVNATPDAIVEAPYQPDYAKSLPERHLWKNVRESFMRHQYQNILKRHGFELTCNGCSAVYLDVALSVSLTGQPEIRNIDAAKACGKKFPEAMRQDFLQFLKIYPYPPGLCGTSVRLRLGSGLSC